MICLVRKAVARYLHVILARFNLAFFTRRAATATRYCLNSYLLLEFKVMPFFLLFFFDFVCALEGELDVLLVPLT